MPSNRDRAIYRMDRRRFIASTFGVVAAMVGLRIRDTIAKDVCFWETRQVVCTNGRRREYRCEVC